MSDSQPVSGYIQIVKRTKFIFKIVKSCSRTKFQNRAWYISKFEMFYRACMLDPPRQENCMVLTGKARQLDMGKTIWPPKHLHIDSFECKHPAGHSMLAFRSVYVDLLRCRSTGPLGYGTFVDTSQISNKLDTSIKFIT